MKKLLLILIVCASSALYAQTDAMFNVYCNDSLVIRSYTSDQPMENMLAMDRTTDGIYFNMHQYSYTLYIPETCTVYYVYSPTHKIVGDHICWMLGEIRKRRKTNGS